MQNFRYPNLVSGTDEWTGWWTPRTGEENETKQLAIVDFGRPLSVGDVLTVIVDFEFDELDVTGSGACVWAQGRTAFEDGEYLWDRRNPITRGGAGFLLRHKGEVVDGAETASMVTVVSEDNGVEGGKGIRYAEIGLRCDNSGGGSLRVRRIMAELNAEGAPHAWAPAAGEVWPE